MRHAQHILALAAVASVAAAQAARAVEIDQLLGRWSSLDVDECVYGDDSEGAPLAIRREGDEIWIGNYGWLCSVPVGEWKRDGDDLVASARACGMEGGDDTFDEEFRLSLNAEGQLQMGGGETAAALRRCPAVE